MTDLCTLTVTELSVGLASGKYTSLAITEACLARIAALEPKLQAFVEVYDKEAREAARAADVEIAAGNRRGPLHGIPIALKDLIELEGRITTRGSRALKDYLSDKTAT